MVLGKRTAIEQGFIADRCCAVIDERDQGALPGCGGILTWEDEWVELGSTGDTGIEDELPLHPLLEWQAFDIGDDILHKGCEKRNIPLEIPGWVRIHGSVIALIQLAEEVRIFHPDFQPCSPCHPETRLEHFCDGELSIDGDICLGWREERVVSKCRVVEQVVLRKQGVEVVGRRILEAKAWVTGDDAGCGARKALFPRIVVEGQRPVIRVDEVEQKGIRKRIDASVERQVDAVFADIVGTECQTFDIGCGPGLEEAHALDGDRAGGGWLAVNRIQLWLYNLVEVLEEVLQHDWVAV